MSAIPGSVRVAGFVAPTDSTDTYPTHDDVYGKGGFRPVADTTARDAISADRRKEGMWVKCLSDSKIYTLSGGITNGHWVEQTMGGNSGVMEVPTYYYVDGGSGNDANDGLTWGTAKKTFGFMRPSSSLPRELRGLLTVNVRGTVLSTDNLAHLHLTFLYGSGSVRIQGTMADVVSGLSVNGYQNTTTAWNYHSYITTTAAGWTPSAYKGFYIQITGSTTYYPILDNTADTIYTTGLPDLSGANTYKIVSPAVIKGALVSDPSTYVTYLDEAVEVQDCSLPNIWIDNIEFDLDRELGATNWFKLGDRSHGTEVQFRNCSFNTNLQVVSISRVYLYGCYFALDNYHFIETSGAENIQFVNSVFGASARTGYGIYYSGNSIDILGCRFKNQILALSTGYNNVGGILYTDSLFEECDSAIQFGGGSLLLAFGGEDNIRFKTVGKCFELSGASVGVFDTVSFVTDTVTSELWLGDNAIFDFADIGVKNISNAATSSSVYLIDSTTYEPKTIDEYDNTISGLASTRYKTAIDEVALSVTSRLVEFSDTTINLVDDTDFTATEASASVTEGAGYTIEITSTTATGNLTVILYQDVARLQPVYTMNVDLTDTDTYRSSEAFGFDLETTGTLYGTAFVSGVPISQTFNVTISATPIQSTGTPTPVTSPYGSGIEDDGTGKPRVALASNSGLQFSTGKLVVDADTAAAIYPVLGAGGMSITGAVDTTTTQSVSAKKLFSAVGATPLAASGAPTSGTYAEGHIVCDSANVYWTCVTAGTPGTWELFSSVYETPTDLATASLTYGTSELLSIPVVGNVGTIQRLQIWGVVAAVAEYSIPFRARVYENKSERGRELIWQGNGLARQTNLSGTLNAGLVAVPVNDNNVADIDEAIVIFESVSRYELGRVVARPTGEFTLDEALVDGSSWAADVYVAVASEWVNIPFVNTEAVASDQKKIYLQIRHDGIATDPAITFYVKVTTHSVGVIR